MTAHAIGVDPEMAASDSHSHGGELESATDEDKSTAMTSPTARVALMLI
jgi:hypothetical protein